MNSQVMYPNGKDWQVNWKNPEHEDKDGMGVVVEIVVSSRLLRSLAI